MVQNHHAVRPRGRGNETRRFLVQGTIAGPGASVLLTSEAKFRGRGRIASAGQVFFGLTTRHVNGGFAGKFLVERRFEVVPETGQSLDIELRLEDFRPQERELIEKHPEGFPAAPVGLELFDWWCCTINEDAGLEITHVALDAGIGERKVPPD